MSIAAFKPKKKAESEKFKIGSMIRKWASINLTYGIKPISGQPLSLGKEVASNLDIDENLSTKSTVFSEMYDDKGNDSFENDDMTHDLEVEPISVHDLDILCKLCEGAQGSVYLVENKHTKQQNALKVYKKSKLKPNSDEVANEVKILSSLNHNMIVNLHGRFENQFYSSILLEFCYGGDLFYHLKRIEGSDRKSFSEDSVKFYISCIILALEHLHKNGILYRDLKPENILIDSEGYPKLCDFGLSIFESDLSFHKPYKQKGSREYFSPEIVSRQPYGKENDWWCLGILTYELLFGKTPFADDNVFKQQNNIRNEAPNLDGRNDLSTECVDFISKLLSKKAVARLGANGFEDLKTHAWLDAVDWDGLNARTCSPPYKIRHNSLKSTKFFIDSFTEQSIDRTFLTQLYSEY